MQRQFLLADVELGADNGLDADFAGGHHELGHAVHVAVVADADGLHAAVGGFLDHAVDFAGAVEQAVLGVVVEVAVFGHKLA